MYANRSEVARTSSEATNARFCSAEGIYKAKAKPVFDCKSPVSTDLFAYICAYLRTFALKTFFFPSRDVPGSHQSKQVNYSASRKNSAKPSAKRHNLLGFWLPTCSRPLLGVASVAQYAGGFQPDFE
jgi:hypothetical protein